MAYLGEGFSQETLGVGVKYDMFWQNTVSSNYFQLVQRMVHSCTQFKILNQWLIESF